MYMKQRKKEKRQGRNRQQKEEKLGKRENEFTATFVAVNVGCFYIYNWGKNGDFD